MTGSVPGPAREGSDPSPAAPDLTGSGVPGDAPDGPPPDWDSAGWFGSAGHEGTGEPRPGPAAAVWVVAGPPGSGKTTVTDLLLSHLEPVPALLDKDILFGGFVAEVQRAAGRPEGEREGDWYDRHVKVHEYDGMTRSARRIRASGCPVVLVAPFTGQIRDPQAWSRWAADLGGDPLHLVWVRSDAATLRDRLLARGSERDAGKLSDFERFVDRMLPDVPPPVPHHEIDNRAAAPDLHQQVIKVCSAAARAR